MRRQKEPPREMPVAAPERLQKIMAAAGLGSRRALEKHISDGAVLVNNQPATLGQSVKPGDRIHFSDRDWVVDDEPDRHQTLIYNKKEGEVTTRSDPEGRPTVFDHLPYLKGSRWVAIGRLDINTTGLLILTTDGELAHAMMHPSNRIDREYVCRIRGQVSDEHMAALKQGVELEDGPARFNDIERTGTAGGSNQWFKVTILEGRNREVRRLWESQGLTVSRLKRVRYGAATLPKRLRVGHHAPVNAASYRVLREDVGLPVTSVRLALKRIKSRSASGRGKSAKPASPWDKRAPKERRSRRDAGDHTASRPTEDTGRGRKTSSNRPGAKPGSPAGAGRRPHPRSRKPTGK